LLEEGVPVAIGSSAMTLGGLAKARGENETPIRMVIRLSYS